MIDGDRWPLVGAARMGTLDEHTIEKLGVPGEVLMEAAGRAVVDALLARFGELLLAPGAEVAVVCGSGNNGGDGFVIARQLHLLGVPVRALRVGAVLGAGGDAAANLARAEVAGVAIQGADGALPERGVVVDALFGTGLARAIKGEPAAMIQRINAARSAHCAVVAVDLPSGIEAETGQVLGCAIEADLCVTISCPKLGVALEPGRHLSGEVLVARIGIVDELPGELRVEGLESAQLWSPAAAGAALPDRPSTGHKGSFGHVLVVAGSEGKTGAAALAARAAGRSGAGLVTIACPRGLADILEVKCTEAMTVAVPETASRALAESALEQLLTLAAERDVLAMGPGVGREPETEALMYGLAAKVGTPMVIDADGLNAFAADPAALHARPGSTVLTPHPGEAARLLRTSAAEINQDRVGAARELAEVTGAVVLLKGAASVTAGRGGRVIVNPTGGPALGSGGTGDVLTGIVAAHLAQGMPALEAAAAAAYLHGAAADRISARRGTSGLLAGELAEELPPTADALRDRARSHVRVPFARTTETERERGDRGRVHFASPTLLPFPGA
jgi:NAD(P)H-hydrate epimerase